MEKAHWIWRVLFHKWPPKYKEVDSVPKSTFGRPPKQGFYLVPMESGRKALVEMYKVWTPRDPGDQHFPRYKFYYYL